MNQTAGPSQPPQLARCERHGYYYNPSLTDGCTVCKDDVPGAPDVYVSKTSERGLVGKVLVVALIGGLGWGGYSFFRAMGERGTAIYAEAQEAASRIDPALVRAQIETVEQLVYAGEATFGHGERIERATLVLQDAVMRSVPRLLATQHGEALAGFGSMAGQYDAVGFQVVDLGAVRREWERVRAEVFHETDWYLSQEP